MNIIQRLCVKHGRMNCPDKECSPQGTVADQIIAQVEKETKDLKLAQHGNKDKPD